MVLAARDESSPAKSLNATLQSPRRHSHIGRDRTRSPRAHGRHSASRARISTATTTKGTFVITTIIVDACAPYMGTMVFSGTLESSVFLFAQEWTTPQSVCLCMGHGWSKCFAIHGPHHDAPRQTATTRTHSLYSANAPYRFEQVMFLFRRMFQCCDTSFALSLGRRGSKDVSAQVSHDLHTIVFAPRPRTCLSQGYRTLHHSSQRLVGHTVRSIITSRRIFFFCISTTRLDSTPLWCASVRRFEPDRH